MLQNFRDNLKGISAYIIVGIIIIPFALFGVDALFLRTSGGEKAANVNCQPVTELHFQRAVAIRKQQMLERYENLSPEMINDELLREPVLDSLVRRKVLETAASDSGMTIARQTVFDLIRDADAFQSDGVFDPARYDFVIRQQGYSPTSHSAMLQGELLVQQLRRGLIDSGFSTSQMASLLADVAEQSRDFYYLSVPVTPLLETVELDEAAVLEHYQNNQDQYASEERVSVEYIEINTDQLLPEIEVTEDQLRDVYQSELTVPVQMRKVAHILLEDDADMATQLNTLQEKLAAGADFAELAKEYSADFGSAESGGELGYVSPGDLPPAMDEALASMSVGEVSAPVVTDAGTHILKLLDLRREEPPTFESRRGEIELALKRELAQARLLELADELRERAYNADSLATVADELGLSLQVSAPFGRSGGEGVAQYPAVVAAAFSEDVLANGYSSELLELNQNRMLVLSLKEYQPATIQPLDVVREQVEHLLRLTKASALASEQATALKARVEQGESIEAVAKAEGLEWQVQLGTSLRGGGVDSQLQNHVFALPAPQADKPVVSVLARQNGDQVVISLIDVEYGNLEAMSDDQKNGIFASAAISSANRDYVSYENMLLAEADVSRD